MRAKKLRWSAAACRNRERWSTGFPSPTGGVRPLHPKASDKAPVMAPRRMLATPDPQRAIRRSRAPANQHMTPVLQPNPRPRASGENASAPVSWPTTASPQFMRASGENASAPASRPTTPSLRPHADMCETHPLLCPSRPATASPHEDRTLPWKNIRGPRPQRARDNVTTQGQDPRTHAPARNPPRCIHVQPRPTHAARANTASPRRLRTKSTAADPLKTGTKVRRPPHLTRPSPFPPAHIPLARPLYPTSGGPSKRFHREQAASRDPEAHRRRAVTEAWAPQPRRPAASLYRGLTHALRGPVRLAPWRVASLYKEAHPASLQAPSGHPPPSLQVRANPREESREARLAVNLIRYQTAC